LVRSVKDCNLADKFLADGLEEEGVVVTTAADITLKNQFKILTNKPITPSVDEIRNNSRSRSAKLRVIEKVKN